MPTVRDAFRARLLPEGPLYAEAECRTPLAQGGRWRSRLAKHDPVFGDPQPPARATANGASMLSRAMPSRTSIRLTRPAT